MDRASAIVTDVGSATGHMGSLAREYQVPTILDTEVATSVIQHGMEITVDAISCNIYEGKVDKLIEYARKKKEPFKDTHLFKTLEKVLKWIVPLNLTDPQSEDFRPENCKTFHDITRFAHEMAMQGMFSIGEDRAVEEIEAVALEAGIPINVHMLDLDGGIRENLKKATPEDIYSLPFSAILKGMKSMKWPEPRPSDAKGLLGMIAHTASLPEEQLQEMGKSSFAVVSKNYMNFSIRLGYHFSLIEAYAGENINDNYIKFFLKGGGASQDRRLRRVRLITKILRHMCFRVTTKEDLIDAILTKYKQATIEERLIILGKLIVYTKQLDMALYNDAITDMYLDQFLKEHAKQ
jgi:pyruvate,water dikinase